MLPQKGSTQFLLCQDRIDNWFIREENFDAVGMVRFFCHTLHRSKSCERARLCASRLRCSSKIWSNAV